MTLCVAWGCFRAKSVKLRGREYVFRHRKFPVEIIRKHEGNRETNIRKKCRAYVDRNYEDLMNRIADTENEKDLYIELGNRIFGTID